MFHASTLVSGHLIKANRETELVKGRLFWCLARMTAPRFEIFFEGDSVVVFLVLGGEQKRHRAITNDFVKLRDGFGIFLKLPKVSRSERIPF